MADDELSLPKATISKVIKDNLVGESIRCSNETRDLICDCCVEFIQMIATESNEVCNKGNKKTISPEHIIEALKNLGYGDYVAEIEDAYDAHKVEAARQSKNARKNKNSGLTEEQLREEQRRLIAQSRARTSTPNTPSALNVQRQQQALQQQVNRQQQQQQQPQQQHQQQLPSPQHQMPAPQQPHSNTQMHARPNSIPIPQKPGATPLPAKASPSSSPFPLPINNSPLPFNTATPPRINVGPTPPVMSLPVVHTPNSSATPIQYFSLPQQGTTPLPGRPGPSFSMSQQTQSQENSQYHEDEDEEDDEEEEMEDDE